MLKQEFEVILKPARLGSIEGCRLGQQVFVIGSPYGKLHFNSITLGIISGLNRNFDEWMIDYGYPKYGWSVTFTTDAAGHPGNSGCPVFTMDGRVRGILVGGHSPVLIYCVPVDLVAKEFLFIVYLLIWLRKT
jgi:serine protease Do